MRRSRQGLVALLAALVVAATLSFTLGRYPVTTGTVFELLAAKLAGADSQVPPAAETVVMLVRLPRILAAMVVGMALALGGTAYQTIFRNPLASPSLLGVSAGAGFGASLALTLHAPSLLIQAAAFAGGLLAVGLSLAFNRLFGSRSMITLVLCGLVAAALFEALIAIIKYFADPLEVLPAITFWLMGSLAKVTTTTIISAAGPLAVCGLVLYLLRWRTNALALGDQEAAALGVEVRLTRLLVILSATFMVAITVSIGGIIGWVGLIIPHAARMLFGLDPDRTYPATALLGALFLLVVDDIARTMGSVEMPLGVLAAVIGAPVFLVLLSRTRQAVWA